MISAFSSKSGMSPFRKSFRLNRDPVIVPENAATKKKKRQSLKIITGMDSQSSTSSITSSPSRVRQKISSFFRTSSPVVTTLKETFSVSSNLSQNSLHQGKRFSRVSFASVAEQSEDGTPTLMQSLGNNNSSVTLSSSSEASDHMPASPADGAATTANTFSHHNTNSKSILDPSFWQPVTSIESNMMSHPYHAPSPPSPPSPPLPPPHKQQNQSSLAFQVYQILGSTLDEVDEEIEKSWEHSRNQLHQLLIIPETCERIY